MTMNERAASITGPSQQPQEQRFEISFLADRSDESCLNEIRRIASLLSNGTALSQGIYQQHSPRISTSAIRSRFGTWKHALELAGLGHLHRGKPEVVTREMLISEIRRVSEIIENEWLTTSLFDVHSKYSWYSVYRRFGSFAKGLEAAGIQGHPQSKTKELTDAECFDNIALVWTALGRTPFYRDMFLAPSAIQGKTYISRWGTWRKTLAAFVLWVNQDIDTKDRLNEKVVQTDASPLATDEKRPEAERRDVTMGLRWRIFKRDRFRCLACGRSPATNLDVELHADHIVSVAMGGKTTFENLQTLCRDCNLGKGALH